MARRIFTLLLLCSAPLAARAQVTDSLTSQKEADIRELIELTGAIALGNQFADQMLSSLKPMFEQAYPSVPQDVMDELMEEMHTELSAIDVAELVIPIYDRHLSAKDIEGLLAFYQTPLGQRVIEKLPVIMQESVAAGQVMGAEAGQRAAEHVVQRLIERGYAQDEEQ